jgi:hypothetical protein
MTKSQRISERGADHPWSVPVSLSEVPEIGRHVDLIADARTRAAIAELAGLAALPRLEASFDVTLHAGDGLRVTGRVSATVGQICVVTLEPIENEIDEPIDLAFMPVAASPSASGGVEDVEITAEDAPEPLLDGTIDLGALATEFLFLGIDTYPRKAGAVFETPAAAGDAPAHPFAALSALKSSSGRRRDGS